MGKVVAVVVALFLVCGPEVLAASAEGRATSGSAKNARPAHQEPALLKSLVAAGWRLANAAAALPRVQVVQEERLETQDFIQYAYAGGSLRLYVSRDREDGDIFAVVVDTRRARYREYAQLGNTGAYAVYHTAPYAIVIPLRPIDPKLFETLKSSKWLEGELTERLGGPSNRWHVHGIGHLGMTYVPQGLTFIGASSGADRPFQYQLYVRVEPEPTDSDLPPLSALAHLDYGAVATETREGFAQRLAWQRTEIDAALAKGKPSPDGQFVVGHVHIGGGGNDEQAVIRERGRPERRYCVGYFTEDTDYIWLDRRTVLCRLRPPSDTVVFYILDAMSLEAPTVVATVADDLPHDLMTFGVSGGRRFWYQTADGKRQVVTVPPPRP